MTEGTGEFELIDRLRERLGPSDLPVGPGDDAAVLPPSPGPVVTVDTSMEGVHFPDDWDDPSGIAYRAIAVSLSDLGAMGAAPDQVLIALGVPVGRDREFWFSLADGVVEAAAEFGVDLAGGDVVRSPALFLSVTAIGSLPEGQAPVSRAGAKPGDLVGVTGSLGGARAGLAVRGGSGSRTADGVESFPGKRKAVTRLVERYLRPVPRLEEGVAFGREGASAMIDLSDGLLADLGHIARESGVGIELVPDSVPVDPDLREAGELIGVVDPLPDALIGGDDYELALAFPPDRRDRLVATAEEAGSGLTVIGAVVEGEGVELPAGFPDPRSVSSGEHGFEHSF
ncbi:MAG: thiamine-phosphate kinase [Solirubrobacterales bacterium]